MTTALIVVDVQNDFCEGGALGVAGGARVAASVAALLGAGGYDYAVATRDHHIDPGAHFSDRPDFVDSWPPHCVVGTPGQQLHPALVDYPFDAVFDKGSYRAAYSGFEATLGGSDVGTRLSDWLASRGVQAVDVVGIATDYCVSHTALDAAHGGWQATVLLDYCATIHPEHLDQVKEQWRAHGVEWR